MDMPLQARLGSPVVQAATQPGGFSRGLTEPPHPALQRTEAQITALPARAPSPRLLWSYDQHGWVALAFEGVQGRLPTLPWQPGELQRVLGVVAELATSLTPTRVMVVDWPWAGIGAAWVDLLVLLPSIAGQGGPQPELLFGRHPVARGSSCRWACGAAGLWSPRSDSTNLFRPTP